MATAPGSGRASKYVNTLSRFDDTFSDSYTLQKQKHTVKEKVLNF